MPFVPVAGAPHSILYQLKCLIIFTSLHICGPEDAGIYFPAMMCHRNLS